MKVGNKHYRTIWLNEADDKVVHIIDQRFLPHQFIIEDLTTIDDAATAIKEMHVRGAGLIGVTAAYGMYLASFRLPDKNQRDYLYAMGQKLKETRPTAVNLAWAVDRMTEAIIKERNANDKIKAAKKAANKIADDDVTMSRKIGEYGLKVIETISESKKGRTVNILTHCNAGWLAFADYGTATAPIYSAQEEGINVHVWVDETRPRNQGASLTAWELQQQGIPYTVIPDNVGGHLMQHGMVDMVIVGTDRTTYAGDVANKIGTYLKALAAYDNHVPFYVALPSSSIDWEIGNGIKEIPIEQRDAEEVKYIAGLDEDDNQVKRVLVTPKESNVANYGFDVTPARLITGLITERGICKASAESIFNLFPEKRFDYV